jgi:hypothetical protein
MAHEHTVTFTPDAIQDVTHPDDEEQPCPFQFDQYLASDFEATGPYPAFLQGHWTYTPGENGWLGSRAEPFEDSP